MAKNKDSNGWLPDAKPGWWSEIEDFGRDPTGYIVGKVATWIVAGIIAMIEALTGAIRSIWSMVASIIVDAIGKTLAESFSNVGESILTPIVELSAIPLELARSMGPVVGPVVVTVGSILMMWLLWQALKRTPGALREAYQMLPFL